MIDSKTLSLLERLKEKTLSKQVAWKKTARDSEYQVILNSGRITCDHWYHEGLELADFRIKNDSGTEILSATGEAGSSDFAKIMSLYSAIETRFLKIEETIEGITSELNSEDTVGK
jgi:hypothetical protein